MPRSALAAALLTVVVGGCGGAAHDKAGAPVPTRHRTLVVQATDAGSPEAMFFQKRVRARSGGSLRVTLREDYGSRLPPNEARLARAVRAGRVDVAILPARAWPAAGVPAFAALQAPFVVTTYDVARAALAGPPGRGLSAQLARTGVVPLALVPAELRRLMTVRPLRGPGDFRGLRIRIADNPTSAADLRALGVRVVQRISSDAVGERLRSGRLDGAETAPIFAVANGYGDSARNISGYALFDRVDTVVAGSRAWRRLSASQQRALRAAAQDAIAFARTLPARDGSDLNKLCELGVHVTTPSRTGLDAIARATEPVRAALRRDPAAGPILHALEATPGTGPRLLALPRACAAHRDARGSTSSGAPFPEGTFVVTTTVADLRAAGLHGRDWSKPIHWTTTFRDGRWQQRQDPFYPDQAHVGFGTYEIDGDRLIWRFSKRNPAPMVVLRWSYYDGRLTFATVSGGDATQTALNAHPWRRAG